MIAGVVFGSIGALSVLWGGVVTGRMLSGMKGAPSSEDATVVVLGCKVRGETPSRHLYRRTKAASRYLQTHPKAKCVVSGGKGSGERISEAEAMYRILIRDGIASSRIVKEESSVNTKENLRLSQEIIKEKNWNSEIILVTDGYHQFRAGLAAQRLGIKSSPVNAQPTWHTFPIDYMREVLAVTRDLLLK